MKSIGEKQNKERIKISNDVAEFLKNGGKIKKFGANSSAHNDEKLKTSRLTVNQREWIKRADKK
jgi:hypothetical protein